jgi:FAD/FMN-containing dehydrogenase
MVIPLHPRPFTKGVASVSEQLEALRSRLVGELITAYDDQYDALRQTQDITLDRRPLAIVRAADEQDVAEAVRFARDHQHPLAVRSGG